MKKLVCEVCGGNDFTKEDGYFVCQHCRTKYLLEEAQKMLVELDESVNASNYLELALKALHDGDCKEATHYANRALEIDASAEEAWKIKKTADYLDLAARNYNRSLAYSGWAGAFLKVCSLGLLAFQAHGFDEKAKRYAELSLKVYPDLPLALEILNHLSGYSEGRFADKVRRDYAPNGSNDRPYGWDGSDPDYNYDYNYDYGSKRNKH